MAKTRTSYVCRDCGAVHPKWIGRCPDCNAWDTLDSFREHPSPRGSTSGSSLAGVVDGGSKALRIDEVEHMEVPRRSTGIEEFDRVLGGGLVPGAAVLLGGEPGVGKSTLLLQAAAQIALQGDRVLYVSSEESPQQIRMRSDRLLGKDVSEAAPYLYVCSETSMAAIADQIQAVDPVVVLLDSIQMVHRSDIDAPPGSTTQLRRTCHDLVEMAKSAHRALVLVGHVTKDGHLAGPKLLEHLVDVVLSIDGDRQHGHRVLRASKNRFGSTQEIGLFEMTVAGLQELEAAGATIRPDGPLVSGSVLVATMAGSRCLPAEVQALTAAGFLGSATRRATGLDSNRLAMLIAVLEKHGGVRLADQNVFAAATGGLRIVEPAADLAVALTVAGAFRGQAIDPSTVVLGEIGLTGTIRSVGQVEQRLRELARRGALRAILPSQQVSAAQEAGLQAVGVDRVSDALALLTPAGEAALPREMHVESKKLSGPPRDEVELVGEKRAD